MNGKPELLVLGGTVVTMNARRDVFADGGVLISGDRITAVGPAPDLLREHPLAPRVDARGKVVFPGLVNTHTHLFQTLLKGPGDDYALYDWLRVMTLPAACQLEEEDCYLAALHGAMEAIHCGCTTLVDFMYVHPRPRLTDAVVRGLEEAGVRAIVARGFANIGVERGMPPALVETPDASLADCERLIKYHNNQGKRVQIGLAPCILWMIPEEAMRETRRLASATGSLVTIHLSETSNEVAMALQDFGEREPNVLRRWECLGPDILLVHCTKCNDDDIAIMRAYDAKISHNPCSNMYLAAGIAPIPQMLRADLTVGLATDGPASNNNQNMIHVLKFAGLLHKVASGDATVIPAAKLLAMATVDGARAIGLEREIGSLEVGKKADLFIAAFDNPFVTPVHDPVSALVYSALGNEPETVIVDGQVVMRRREVTTVDEVKVRTKAQKAAEALIKRAGISRPEQRTAAR